MHPHYLVTPTFDINVVDDNIDDTDIVKNIINTKNCEDAFYVADIGDIIKRHQEWISKMPKVIPHYGMSIAVVIFLIVSYMLTCTRSNTKVGVIRFFFQISAIKCNSNATVIKVLAALNACFDCASKVSFSFRRASKHFRCLYKYKLENINDLPIIAQTNSG